MVHQQKPSKRVLLARVEQIIQQQPNLQLLDLGCGKSLNFLPLIKQYPSFQYIGIEPHSGRCSAANTHLEPYANATIIQSLAYGKGLPTQFDVVVSLSVLEHVKHLSKFIKFAAAHTKAGGNNAHLYDLGHSLYPSSLQERIHAGLCSNALLWRLAPESKFTAYVSLKAVKKMHADHGLQVQEVTHYNMPNHVRALKSVQDQAEYDQLLEAVVTTETALNAAFSGTQLQRELLFPSPCIWSQKQ